MLRAYRPFRSLLGSARLSARWKNGQTVRIERVKIKKAKPVSRLFGNAIKGALVFQLLLWTLLPLPESDDESKHDPLTEPRFIPFPFTTKARPPEYYSGSSPEWQEFVRISKDPKIQHDILQLAADYVLKTATTSQNLKGQNVGSDFKIRRYWLDIYYPYMAPPEFERSGLLIKADSLEWTTMPIDHSLVLRLERVLWPQPLAMGVWAMGAEAFKEASRHVAKYFSFASDDMNNPPARPGSTPELFGARSSPEVQKALERLRQQATRRPEQVNDPRSMASSSSTRTASSEPSTPRDAGGSIADPNRKKQQDDKPWIESVGLSVANSQAWRRFRETFAQSRRAKLLNPPRGSVAVQGLVELETSRAYLVVEAMTWYDPKTRSLVPESTRMSLKGKKFKVQSPVR
ncbi:hypothetical protein VTJ83DRAFT_103 [Remersonia thermophila]|uniref:Uncharacterized protein n=1 Tax=Remersonia thermophila TaxID=72144 RepID=A0ABR4DKB6_9PEZI